MADQLKDLVLRLSADSRQLVSELRKVESGNSRTTKRIESDWKKTSSTISSSFSKLSSFAGLGALTGGLSVVGLSALASDAVEAGDAIDKLAGQLGISTTALQEYQFAADLSGVSQEQFSVGLRTLGRNLGLAAVGTGEAKTALEALGVAVRDSGGEVRTIESVFEDVLRSLGQVEDAAVATALAQRILGESGAVFVNLAGDLDGLIARARELGIAIDDDVIRSMVATKDKGTELSAILRKDLSESLSFVSDAAVVAKSKFVDLVEAMSNVAKQAGLFEALRATVPELIQDPAELWRQIDETSERIRGLKADLQEVTEKGGLNPQALAFATDRIQSSIRAAEEDLNRLGTRLQEITGSPKTGATSGTAKAISPTALDPSSGKAEARAAAKEAAAATRELEAAQQRLNSVIEASFTPAERLVATMDQLGLDYREGKLTAEQFAQGQEAIGRQFDVLDQKIESSALRELDQILQASLTPAEKLVAQLDRIGQLYAEGSISAEQFTQGQEALENQIAGIETEEARKQLTELERVGAGVFQGLTGAVSDFVLTGKADFASFSQSIASELLQLGINAGLATAFPSLAPLLGFAKPKALGGPISAGQPYLVGENGPELILPRNPGFVVPNVATRGGGAAVMAMPPPAPVVVNIHNSSRSDVQANERLGPSGTREIEILVTELVARDIARGGASGRAVDRRFGVRPRGA